jgi:hypothetical protein
MIFLASSSLAKRSDLGLNTSVHIQMLGRFEILMKYFSRYSQFVLAAPETFSELNAPSVNVYWGISESVQLHALVG